MTLVNLYCSFAFTDTCKTARDLWKVFENYNEGYDLTGSSKIYVHSNSVLGPSNCRMCDCCFMVWFLSCFVLCSCTHLVIAIWSLLHLQTGLGCSSIIYIQACVRSCFIVPCMVLESDSLDIKIFFIYNSFIWYVSLSDPFRPLFGTRVCKLVALSLSVCFKEVTWLAWTNPSHWSCMLISWL